MTTFNTGKVLIGLLHQPAMRIIQGDALRLQTALLDKRTARPALVARVLSRFWSWA